MLWRSCKSPEGAIRAFFTVGFIALVLSPVFLIAFSPDQGPPNEYIDATRYAIDNYLPFAFSLGFFVAMMAPKKDQTLMFSQSEIDWLFTGPFSRRELLIYKLFGVVTSTLAICFAMNCFVSSVYLFLDQTFFVSFIRGFIMISLAFLLMRLTFVWSGLVRKSIIIRFLTPFRKLAAITLGLFWLAAIYSIRDEFDWNLLKDETKVLATLNAFTASDAYQWGITPFRVFSNLLLSRSIIGTLSCFLLCLTGVASMLWLIVKTDNNFIEKEIDHARIRVEAAKRTQSIEMMLVPSVSRHSLPMLPFMGGIGPITWRQLQTFFRVKKLVILTMMFYFLLYLFLIFTDQKIQSTQFRFSMGVASLSMITLTIGLTLPMGFQADVKKMDIFKSLPFSKWQIAAGQLLGPTLLLVAIQYVSIFLFMWLALDQWLLWLTAAAFAPLVSIVILSIINSLSLLYPSQSNEGVARELENVGHILVFTFLLMLSALAIFAMLIGAVAAAHYSTHSLPVVVFACWLVMLVSSAVGVWTTGWAFGRFDVSKHRM